MSTYRKKLIEVSLPLEAINVASAREKSIRHGHPSTLHLWWARRPLAAARAVLFAQLVDDPSSWPELFPTEEAQTHERQRLFRLIEALVQWDTSNNAAIVNAVRLEIARSHARASSSDMAAAVLADAPSVNTIDDYLATEMPAIHDPFAGGGTIPLEAQRLGLRSVASDLNPVAVLINKALVEIPVDFSGMLPVNPSSPTTTALGSCRGAEGLAEDVRFYGAWVLAEAQKKIGSLYPEITLPDTEGGGHATAIAWLWARTVESPNPAFKGCHVPLVSTFWLSKMKGRAVWLEPVLMGKAYTFKTCEGTPGDPTTIDAGTKLGRGANFRCILSDTPIEPEYIKAEGRAKRLGYKLMAVVAEGRRGRIYVSPTAEMEQCAKSAIPPSIPDAEFAKNSRHMTPWIYGLDTFADLFTPRQLVALTTLADLVREVVPLVTKDAIARGLTDTRARRYAESVGIYLALVVSGLADRMSSLCTWDAGGATWGTKTRATFARQALSMTWDFAEVNPFSTQSGSFGNSLDYSTKAIASLYCVPSSATATVAAASASSRTTAAPGSVVISTDPPYYDNVPYADLSDFFYVWLRRSLRTILPDVLATVLVPKSEELVADPFRHSSRDAAEQFFVAGMTEVLETFAITQAPDLPVTLYYAFKQSERDAGGVASTGWEWFLESVLGAGFAIDGTWPLRTELSSRMRGLGSNALASSIVLVCRKRGDSAPSTTRGDFRRLLRKELPDALKKLQQGNIAPVDVAQASIGPGMATFSRHKQVLEADGSAMSVRAALQLINEVLDEYLASGEGDFDADTRFAITWYEQHGWSAGPFGEAETLAKARNVSVSGVVEAGICHSGAGKVRILKRPEMRPLDYDPAADERPTIWEFTQHMIRVLEDEGEEAAARLLKKLGSASDATRELAYRLYNTCERKKWAEDARSYNGLILAWPELEKLAAKVGDEPPSAAPSKPGKKGSKAKKTAKGQARLFEGDDDE